MYLIIDKECNRDSIYWEDIFADVFNSLEEAKEALEHIFNEFVESELVIVGNDVERTETSIKFNILDYGHTSLMFSPTTYHYVIYEAKEVSNDK